MAKWKELSDIGIPISTPSPEAIVRAAWERVALELDAEAKTYGEHGYSFSKVALICEAKRIRSLASDPAEVAAIIKKAGEDRG